MEVREQVRTDDPVTGTAVVREASGHVATPEESKNRAGDKIDQVIWMVVGLINALLILRIVFYLLGGQAVGFASALYSFTYPLVAPFSGIFAAPQASGSYFDSPALTAIIVYSLIGWGLTKLVDVLTKPAAPQA